MFILAQALACVSLAVPTYCQAQASSNAAETRPEILRQLDGNWVMSGDVRGKPVNYRMVATPALQGTFTEMHMRDMQVPAQYEATVYIGYDAASKNVIAHWMDSFGPKHSIPHATGHIAGNTIQFTFPYPSGQFRNTWNYDPATASWRFVLESAQPDGSWKHFALYEVKRN
jgi:hypothetical protein